MRLLAAAALLPPAAPDARAQRTPGTVVTDFRDGIGDVLHVWASPLRAGEREWRDFAIVTMAAGMLVLADEPIGEWIAEHPNAAVMEGLEPFREGGGAFRVADLGRGKFIQPISGAFYLAGFIADRPGLRDAGMGCAASQQAQTLVHSAVLQAVSRRRPRVSDGDAFILDWGYGPWNDHAFYGGHAANIMACVTFFNERYDLGPAEPVLYAVAVAVGVGRMADQTHWASDTFVGMAYGHALGRMIARRQLARRARARRDGRDERPVAGGREPRSARLFLEPSMDPRAGAGVRLGWRATF
jgi:hypothetical protein